MKHKRPKPPDEAMAKFGIIAGGAMVIIPLIATRLELGQRISAVSMGLMGLSWGLKQAAAAKKWRQEYGEPSHEEQMEIRKSHSISNLPILLGWLALGIALLALGGLVLVSLFHYQGTPLVHRNPDSFPPLTMPTSTNAQALQIGQKKSNDWLLSVSNQ